MGREVTLVLVAADGELLGSLPPIAVELPYWQETREAVHAVWDRYAVRLDVLRLLRGDRPLPVGGAVTYLAELREATALPDLGPVDDELVAAAADDEPLRSPYARLGGPRATLGWARDVVGPGPIPWQQRTWNLSAIWELEDAGTTTWLKQVPAFFWHEPAVLDWLARAVPELGPTVVAHDDEGRMLLEHVPGDDFYDAGLAERVRIGALAHRIQLASAEAVDDLAAAGVPDRRGPAQADWIRRRVEGWVDGHPAEGLLGDLDARLAELDACGLPDTLVHGDAHPGNARGDLRRTVFLDWGDAFVGNPVFDVRGMTGGRSPDEAREYERAWAGWWQRSAPASDPSRAIQLAGPLASLRLAAVYADFLANIEPAQHPFHIDDVRLNLDAAVSASRS